MFSVIQISGALSPVAMIIACLILFLYRPIFLELGSALRLNGANYSYLLQFSGKTLGLIGAAATLLDAVATSTVSAATAASYLMGEFSAFPMPLSAFTVILLLLFTLVAMLGICESSGVTLSFTITHVSFPPSRCFILMEI
jgi:amino acid transporter